MLDEFLDRFARVTGKRYTKAQFGGMVKEAIKADADEKKEQADDEKARIKAEAETEKNK